MVNSRLTWYLEHHKVITEHQSGFRRRRSTVDNLVTLETSIRDAFVGRKHLVSIFFDLEKAYDTTWKHGILLDLYTGFPQSWKVMGKKAVMEKSWKLKKMNKVMETEENE